MLLKSDVFALSFDNFFDHIFWYTFRTWGFISFCSGKLSLFKKHNYDLSLSGMI